jgi:hypothetical protein
MILVAATSVFGTSHNGKGISHQTVQNEVLKVVLCLLFDGQGIHALMTAVNSGSLLRWFYELQRQITIQVVQS